VILRLDNSVGTATGYGLEGQSLIPDRKKKLHGPIPDSGKINLSPSQRSDRLWDPSSLVPELYWGLVWCETGNIYRCSFNHKDRAPCAPQKEAECTPEMVWSLWRTWNISNFSRIKPRFLRRLARNLFAIPTPLSLTESARNLIDELQRTWK
jgi:hypothetical protein